MTEKSGSLDWLRPTRVACGILVLLFLMPALGRLNGLHLFNPDSADYLLGARSLAALGQYRTLDLGGEPLNTLRPPGLSWLLLPASVLSDGSSIAAGLVVVASSLAWLFLFYRLARESADERWALLVLAVLASLQPRSQVWSKACSRVLSSMHRAFLG